MFRAALIVLGLMFALPAYAGDAAKLNVIGFSADRKYFAFEQYGQQDGSGFSYSDIFITDIETNTWVKGTPLRFQAESEEVTIEVARKSSANAADPLLLKYKVDQIAEVIAANPMTEVVVTRKTVTFDTGFVGVPLPLDRTVEGRFELNLTTSAFPATEKCPTEDGKVSGFALRLTNTITNAITIAYEDAKIPDSRQCPIDYDIETIVSYRDLKDEPAYVAMISVYSLGFEGPDRRFIAVPINPQ
jgi:predicted secreted protein